MELEWVEDCFDKETKEALEKEVANAKAQKISLKDFDDDLFNFKVNI